jgi:hypothetical protein
MLRLLQRLLCGLRDAQQADGAESVLLVNNSRLSSQNMGALDAIESRRGVARDGDPL